MRSRKFNHLTSLLLILGLMLVGCAKKLEDKLPDNFQRDVHAISAFSGEGIIKASGNGNIGFQAQSGLENRIYAMNEKSLYPVEVVSGPSFMSSLFTGYQIEASQAGETFKVSFKLTKDSLIVYMDVAGHQISKANQQLAITKDGKKQVALFHLAGLAYGKVEKTKNDLEEETRNVVFKNYPQAEATHIKLEITADKRINDGLRGLTDEILDLQAISNKSWSLNELFKLYNYTPAADSASVQSHLNKNNIQLKVLDDNLYALAPVKIDELNTVEKLALKKGDPRITKCSGESASESCVMKAVLKSSISKANLKLTKDSDGNYTGTASLDAIKGKAEASFATISSSTKLLPFRIDERITGIENKWIVATEEIDQKIWEVSKLREKLNLTKLSDDQKHVMTKIVDAQIYVLVAKDKADLRLEEQVAIGKDPRYMACSEELAQVSGIAKEACATQPVVFKTAVPSSLEFKLYEDKELPEYSFIPSLNLGKSEFMMVIQSIEDLEFTYIPHLKNRNLFNKKRLENQEWSGLELGKALQRTEIFSKHKIIITKILDHNLWILVPTALENLSTMEVQALGKDPRLSVCKASLAEKAGLDSKNCALKAIQSLTVGHSVIEFEARDNSDIPTFSLESAGKDVSTYVTVAKNQDPSDFTFASHLKDENIFTKDDLEDKIFSGAELDKKLRRKNLFSKFKLVSTKIVDNTLMIMLPFSLEGLSTLEIEAIDNDPRIVTCSEEVAAKAGLDVDNCVLKTVQYLHASHTIVEFTDNDNSDLPSFNLRGSGQDISTHIRISKTQDPADYTYAQAYKDENLFKKSELQEKVFTGTELGKKLRKYSAFNDLAVVQTKILDSSLWILEAVKKETLSVLENEALDQDPRITSCTTEAAKKANLSKENCVLKATKKLYASHAIVEFTERDNSGFPQLSVRSAGKDISTHLLVTKTQDAKDFTFAEAFTKTENDDIFVKADIDGKEMSASELEKKFGIRGLKGDSFLVNIVNNNLYALKAVKKSDLHKIEQATVEEKDPRYMSCSAELASKAKLSADDCIMQPQKARFIYHGRLTFSAFNNSDIPRFSFSTGIDPFLSKFITINKDSKAIEFKYMDAINTTDRIITDKKSDFDTNAEYLYVPFSHGTPREVTAADPFIQGAEKIVKIKFAKNGLEVYEIEKDDRFAHNDLNQKPVLLIPGRYEHYKCHEDNAGRCTLGTTSDRDRKDEDKRFFSPTLERLQVREVNDLDLFALDGSCLSHMGTKVVKQEIINGSINIELEKTYKTHKSFSCIANLFFDDRMSAASFKVRFHYSLVKLDQLASKDYEPIAYPIQDHDQFGFFKNESKKLNDNFDPSRKDEKYLLNRWNPKKKEIVYYLSESFNEPAQKIIKDATYKAIKTINSTLDRAKAGIRIKLEEPANKSAGDLRNNTLVLITDPLNSGLLGYAPTVTNPRTGEIVQGHINMYSGVIRSMSRRVWETMVDFTVDAYNEEQEALRAAAIAAANAQAAQDAADNAEEGDKPEQTEEGSDAPSETDTEKALKANTTRVVRAKAGLNGKIQLTRFKKELSSAQIGKKVQKLSNKAHALMLERLKRKSDSLESDQKELSQFEKKAKMHKERLERLSKNNAYAVEFFKIGGTVKTLFPGIKKIAGVLNKNGTLKRWRELNKAQKNAAMDIIIPYTYTSTLVHEFGHNLGLRHNFIGSFDADNFYSKEEAQALGLRTPPAYSSVMDYAGSELNELTIFGKYDTAALRFAYAREVETKSGEFIKLKGSLDDYLNQTKATARELRDQARAAREAGDEDAAAQMEAQADKLELKEYSFCTDGNAGLSISCNRFDEGTSLVEIANLSAKRYEDLYKYRNYRDDRDFFQAEGLGGYLVARYHEFNRIRDIFEEYEFFASIFEEDLMVQGCSPAQVQQYPICKDINDRRDSVKIAGDFFLKILKTPDHLCALAKAETPEKIEETKKLADIYDDVRFDIPHITKSCFDPAVIANVAENGMIVVGEAGKFLNGHKDNDPNHIYSNDRGVRGIWVDKVLALKSLVQRRNGRGVTERIHRSFMDHQQIAPKVGNFLRHITMGAKLDEPVLFKKQDGSTFAHEYTLGMEDMIDGPQRALFWVKAFFGLPTSGKAILNEIILKNAVDFGLTDDEEYRDTSRGIMNFFTVRKADIDGGIQSEDIEQVQIDETVFGATEYNGLALEMINAINNLDYLQELDQAIILKVYQNRANPQLPDGLTDEEKDAIKLEVALMDAVIGALQGGVVLDLAFLVERFGEEQGTRIFNASQLGVETLQKLKSIKENLGSAPDDATEVEKELYEMELETLESFLKGTLAQEVERYMTTLPILPNHVDELSRSFLD